jgi:hypothetical protein
VAYCKIEVFRPVVFTGGAGAAMGLTDLVFPSDYAHVATVRLPYSMFRNGEQDRRTCFVTEAFLLTSRFGRPWEENGEVELVEFPYPPVDRPLYKEDWSVDEEVWLSQVPSRSAAPGDVFALEHTVESYHLAREPDVLGREDAWEVLSSPAIDRWEACRHWGKTEEEFEELARRAASRTKADSRDTLVHALLEENNKQGYFQDGSRGQADAWARTLGLFL